MILPVHKSMQKRLRKLALIAHERELAAALKDLHAYFVDWQAKKIDSFALNDQVHKFHQETAREIWKMYSISMPKGMELARALTLGFLNEEEVGQDLVAELRPLIDCWKNNNNSID